MSMQIEEELATVKKPNEVERLSRSELEQRIKMITASKRDIVWWAEHFFRIIPASGGLQVIKLYPKQQELLRCFADNSRICTLASRQVGKTTTYTVFCMWLATLFPEKKIMICANKLQTAIEVMDRLHLAYEYLPKWIKPGIVVNNKQEITFSNRSSIRAFATSSSASRGFSAQCVIIDEMAFIPKNIIDEFFASVMPVISSVKNSKAIVVSTPNGATGMYYDIWQQANSKDKNKNASGWVPFRIDWWEVPGRDEKWKEQQIETVGIDKWRQEFCNEFSAGSTSLKLIPDDIIEKYKMKLSEYKLRETLDGKKQKFISPSQDRTYEFTMWHEFNPKHTYLASGDVAEGTGGDSSVLYVWDITDIRNIVQCAKFDSATVSPLEFAYITSKILGLYGNPYFVCESNGVGAGYLDALMVTYGYQNIVRESKEGKVGVTSHVQTKGKACLWLKDMFTMDGIGWTIYDKDLVDEMTTFVKKDSKQHLVYNAIAKCHDDHIMALCWAAWILNPEIVESYYIVTTTHTTVLDKIIPQTIEPMREYSEKVVLGIVEDPLYKQFLEYKQEMIHALGKAFEAERKEELHDKFAYTQQMSFNQMYFPDDPDDCNDWYGNSNSQMSIGRMPTFAINHGIY